MFEKVNPAHPDKLADRIAGALVDLAYAKEENPRIAVEVLLGHGQCNIIAETSVKLDSEDICAVVQRISGITDVGYMEVPQDVRLAKNQKGAIRCGDNGIFRGMPVTNEQKRLAEMARLIYRAYPSDGKYILADNFCVICQSKANSDGLESLLEEYMPVPKYMCKINPLGYWTGGEGVDSGATNRKLGSDMGDAVTGGGLHGKDLSKADVSVNIYAHLLAQEKQKPVELCCAIGDEKVGGKPYPEIVEAARQYIKSVGGFEKFAEWGLI